MFKFESLLLHIELRSSPSHTFSPQKQKQKSHVQRVIREVEVCQSLLQIELKSSLSHPFFTSGAEARTKIIKENVEGSQSILLHSLELTSSPASFEPESTKAWIAKSI